MINMTPDDKSPTRGIVDRLCYLESKVNTLDNTLNDLIGNIIEYRNDLAMVRERLRHFEAAMCKKGV